MRKKPKKEKYILDAWKYRVPIFRNLISKTSIARFSRTFGTLLSSGGTVLRALLIVMDTAGGNGLVDKAVQRVHDAVKEGKSIAAPLSVTKIFPDMVVSMIEVGEETGKTPGRCLKRELDTYEEELENALDANESLL